MALPREGKGVAVIHCAKDISIGTPVPRWGHILIVKARVDAADFHLVDVVRCNTAICGLPSHDVVHVLEELLPPIGAVCLRKARI